ncbi:helix-turn-helix domain-containing protein [Agrobacterium vaccinii]|uniref:helix-turn-helix domain-containing protein n=1 Tax=Agrobacterium vaccinii TaxID=2735528 RepID=UPI001E57BA2B|nr:helix-turn-helix transcriptional regulator [Agrobacterium vaccinii]UHS56813.1 helix-turn-helix transcriptional regulator [Agrobacterium vaccinii]
MLTSSQCRAARALLDWSQQKLADQSRIGNATIRNFESGKSVPQNATVEMLQQCFEQAGVKFIDDNQTSAAGGPGVRLTLSPKPEVPGPETVQYPENMEPDAPTGAGG